MSWCVITKVPDPNKGETGNLYHITELYIEHQNRWWANKNGTTIRPLLDKSRWYFRRVMKALNGGMFMAPVFEVGEVLWLNEWGREPYGHGRKPSKWLVETEEFNTFEEALQRAIEVSE